MYSASLVDVSGAPQRTGARPERPYRRRLCASGVARRLLSEPRAAVAPGSAAARIAHRIPPLHPPPPPPDRHPWAVGPTGRLGERGGVLVPLLLKEHSMPAVPVHVLASVLLGLVIVGMLMARQIRWRAFDPSRAFRLPLLLALVGLIPLVRSAATATTVDLSFLLLELVLAAGVGLAMGRLTTFRRDPAAPGTLQVRTGWFGASLWLVLIAVRLGVDAVADSLGAHLLTSTGVILIVIAASRATRSVIVLGRAPHNLRSSA